jgi:hypothetical protein
MELYDMSPGAMASMLSTTILWAVTFEMGASDKEAYCDRALG